MGKCVIASMAAKSTDQWVECMGEQCEFWVSSRAVCSVKSAAVSLDLFVRAYLLESTKIDFSDPRAHVREGKGKKSKSE